MEKSPSIVGDVSWIFSQTFRQWQPRPASARSPDEDRRFLVWITEPTQKPLILTMFGRPGLRGAIKLFAGLRTTAFLRSQTTPGTVVAALGARGAWEIRNARGGDRAFGPCGLLVDASFGLSLAGCCWV
jgi:hypothetical protein